MESLREPLNSSVWPHFRKKSSNMRVVNVLLAGHWVESHHTYTKLTLYIRVLYNYVLFKHWQSIYFSIANHYVPCFIAEVRSYDAATWTTLWFRKTKVFSIPPLPKTYADLSLRTTNSLLILCITHPLKILAQDL